MAVIRNRLVKGDPTSASEYIVSTHEAYKLYYNRWTFLADSYNGGFDYFYGKYLEPFVYESRDDYEKRLRTNALDNHVKAIVGIYNSFLFRRDIKRDLGNLEADPQLDAFFDDADLDGRTFAAFMKDVSRHSQVYGHCWVIVDKPNTNVSTRADELEQEVRPYVSLFTPENVLDWQYEREENGYYKLVYLKVKEEIQEGEQYIREYTPEETNVYRYTTKDRQGEYMYSIPNTLGKIPCVVCYSQRSNLRGVGVSAVGDIADMQKNIYEETAEIHDIIKLTNHPTLVKTRGTDASAGAGAIVTMEENLEPGLKPYLLQPNGSSIDAVLDSIQKKVDAIDRMACVGGIRSVESRRLSGIGLQTEFQMLNAKLADFAMCLEHCEEQIWRLYALFQGMTYDGSVQYPRSFSIQDKANDIAMLKLAKESNIADTRITDEIDKRIYETITEESMSDLPEQTPAETPPLKLDMQHPPMENAGDMIQHMRDMIQEGYTNEQILEIHPEINAFFGDNDGEETQGT